VIRAVVAHSAELVREAVAGVLSAGHGIDVVAIAGHVDDLLHATGRLQPNVAIVDIDLAADGDCASVLTGIREGAPACAPLLVVDVRSSVAVQLARTASSWQAPIGLIGLDSPVSKLVDCVRQVDQGEKVIDSAIAVGVLKAPPSPLTQHERAVLQLTAHGLRSWEIANRLHLSPGTVRNYVSAAIRKTGAHTRIEALRVADEAGWI
jgi:two-component system response regulator DesR